MKKRCSYMKYVCLGLLCLTHSCLKSHKLEVVTSSHEPNPFINIDPNTLDEQLELLEQNLENLFTTHAILLNDAFEAAFHHASQNVRNLDNSNLFENAHEIGNQFVYFYGQSFANRLEELLAEQIKLRLDYMYALQIDCPDLAGQVYSEILTNSQLLVEFLNIMNPYFAAGPEQKMLDKQIDLELQLISVYFKSDFITAEDLKAQLVEHLDETARHLAKAVSKQMKDFVPLDQEGDTLPSLYELCVSDDTEDFMDGSPPSQNDTDCIDQPSSYKGEFIEDLTPYKGEFIEDLTPYLNPLKTK